MFRMLACTGLPVRLFLWQSILSKCLRWGLMMKEIQIYSVLYHHYTALCLQCEQDHILLSSLNPNNSLSLATKQFYNVKSKTHLLTEEPIIIHLSLTPPSPSAYFPSTHQSTPYPNSNPLSAWKTNKSRRCTNASWLEKIHK